MPVELWLVFVTASAVLLVIPGPTSVQVRVCGATFAVLTMLISSLLGRCAARLSNWLARRPGITTWLNLGAGVAFVASGLSILAPGNRR